jgi:hypothetical protein
VLTVWLVGEYIWGFVAVVVLWFGSRWPLERPVLGRRVALHLLHSAGIAGAQLAARGQAQQIGLAASQSCHILRLCRLKQASPISSLRWSRSASGPGLTSAVMKRSVSSSRPRARLDARSWNRRRWRPPRCSRARGHVQALSLQRGRDHHG